MSDSRLKSRDDTHEMWTLCRDASEPKSGTLRIQQVGARYAPRLKPQSLSRSRARSRCSSRWEVESDVAIEVEIEVKSRGHGFYVLLVVAVFVSGEASFSLLSLWPPNEGHTLSESLCQKILRKHAAYRKNTRKITMKDGLR
jgi:hypothetical protein